MSGFHKRKQQRKKKAQQELERRVKNELKNIRTKTQDELRKKYQSFKPIHIPILDDANEDEQNEDVEEDEEVLVTVKTLGRDELAQRFNWIGDNRPPPESDPEPEPLSDEEQPENEVEGFSLKKVKKSVAKPVEDEEAAVTEEAAKKLQSKKEINREMKKKTLKALKKSKALKSKDRIQRHKNIKKSRRQAHFKKKSQAHSKDYKKRSRVK